MISNKKFIYYKLLDIVELYNFDINFVFHPVGVMIPQVSQGTDKSAARAAYDTKS